MGRPAAKVKAEAVLDSRGESQDGKSVAKYYVLPCSATVPPRGRVKPGTLYTYVNDPAVVCSKRVKAKPK